MYTISRHIIVEEIEGKIVLFDPEKLLFYNLNETASFIFNQLKKKKSPIEIVRLTATEFNASPKRIEDDVKKITKDLETKGIIRKKR